jgi:carbon-monoxide dehydrogenase medium subunit
MHLPQFEYLAPRTREELAGLLSEHGDSARILAGGTDLLPSMKDRLVRPEYLIDIGNLTTMNGITEHNGTGLVIGAATKLAELEHAPLIKDRYKALHQAITVIGAVQVRAMASVGGNICNASPAADLPPALIAFGTRVNLFSRQGPREMDLEDFITGNRKTVLREGEFLESIVLPPPQPNSASAFTDMVRREAMEIAMVNVAVNLALDADTGKVGQAAIIMGAVAPHPLRARRAEELLQGQQPDDAVLERASAAAADETQAIDDFRASAAYRREVTRTLVGRALREALAAIRQAEG